MPPLISSFPLQVMSAMTILSNRYTAFACFMLGYSYILSLCGGLTPLWSSLRLEAPILLYGYFLLNGILKKNRWQPWLAALPLALAYTVADIYFIIYSRFVRLIEITEIPELLDILPGQYIALIVIIGAASALFFVLSLDWRRGRRSLLIALPALAFILCMEFFPGRFLGAFQSLARPVTDWSDANSVADNGRFTMVAYFEAQRKNSIHKTIAFRHKQKFIEQMKALSLQIKGAARNRNVHVLVLESFLDPSIFANLRYSQSPTAPAFRQIVGDTDNYSISPVFGGGTAQAEFEILCGVPALRALSSVEFNVFTGAKTFCLPTILNDAGYQTIASNGHKPKFFNAIPGYTGTGFQNIFFPKENAPHLETYLTTGDVEKEWYMFDGKLLSQNLAFIRQQIKEHPEKPIFNYVMSIYGHLPHYMDETVRPQFITLQPDQKHQDEHLTAAVNQHYYRTEAIASYINELVRLDPQSLIILVSDHLPPLSSGAETYNTFQYMKNIDQSIYYNRLVVLENGKAKQYDVMHHYDIPKLIANYLTDGAYCRTHQCPFFKTAFAGSGNAASASDGQGQDDYMTIMAHATM